MDKKIIKRRILTLWLFSMIAATQALGQSISTTMGARSQGLGNASAALADEWSVWNNPGGLGYLKKLAGGMALHRSPALPGADRLGALAVSPFSFGVMALSIFRFGDELYSESLASVGYGHRLGLASLGIRADFIQYRAEGFETSVGWGATFGGIAELSETVALGALVSNLNQPKLPNGEPLPVKLTAGVRYKPTSKFLLCGEIAKDLDFDPTIKGGMEYQFHRKFIARTGFNLNPTAAFFGLGFATWKLQVDLAWQYNRELSHSLQLSLGVAIDKVKREDD